MRSSFSFLVGAAFLAIALALTAEQKQSIQQVTKECKEKTGVSQESLNKAHNGEDVDDEKLKEQGLCFAQKSHIIDENGHFPPNLRSSLMDLFHNEAEVDNIITRCAITKATPKETAYHYLHCLHKIKHNFHS